MLRTRIRDETGLVASVGVATTKFLAKLASDLAKPDGLLVVAPGTELAFLDPLPVTRLWGVGPATFRTLERMGVRTIGDVARAAGAVLVARARRRRSVAHLHALARNDDDRDGRARARDQVDRGRGDVRHRPAHPTPRASASSCGSPTASTARVRARRARARAPSR